MSHQMNHLKPLFLSAEEAMVLLDLCIMSHAEFDRDSEGMLLKLSDLVRQHIAACAEDSHEIHPSGESDSRMELPETAQDSLRYAESAWPSLAGAEFVASHRIPERRSALKPCPADYLRRWAAPSSV